MSDIQVLTFAGVIVLLILRQPLYAIVWLCTVFFGILEEGYHIPALALIIFVSLFQMFNTEARK